MVRRRWPDVIIVVGILALAGTGVWAIWGDEIQGGGKKDEKIEKVEGGGQTLRHGAGAARRSPAQDAA